MTFPSHPPAMIPRERRSHGWRRGVAALVLVVLAAGCGVPVAVEPMAVGPRPELSVRQLRERLVEMTVPSRVLSATTMVRVLLPVGWRADDHDRWPVLYLLHGCCDGDRGYAMWSESVDLTVVDELRDVLVVMPDGGSFGFYSDWLDGPRWESYHLEELPALVAERFGATDRRVVAGNSMGGFGALSYAGRHPGMFRAAASFSGVAHPLLADDGPALMRDLADGQGHALSDLWGELGTHRATWAEHNPFDLAADLSRIPVYLSCGDGRPGPLGGDKSVVDSLESRLARQNAALAQRLRELSAPKAVINLYGAGTHSWAYWYRELRAAAPMLRAALR